jgi:two-component system chemotaxis sensor kinase CheA
VEDLDDIIREFLVESYENLDQLDRDLVALEVSPGSRELLGSIFRTIHTIKGTSGFLAFGRLEKITHAGENLLVELRDGRRAMDGGTTDVLLRMVDTVRAILATIDRDGAEGEVGIAAVIEEIRVLQETVPEAAVPVPVPVAAVVADVVAAVAAPVPADTRQIVKRRVPTKIQVPARTPAQAGQAEVPEPRGPSRDEALVADEEVWAPIGMTPQAPVSIDPALVAQIARVSASALANDVEPVEATDPQDEAGEQPGAPRQHTETSIRVDIDLLEGLMRQVSELVLTRNQISRLAQETSDVDLLRSSQRLSLIASELQEGVMKTRMQPIDHVWNKMPRIVRDLAAICKRQVRLDLIGGETELDRSLLEAVKDPLTHLVRNAVDHGIESAEERVAAKKSAAGLVTLRAYHAGGQVLVEVTDDGRGIDPHRVAGKAIERGLRTAAEVSRMSTTEIFQLLFLPGFSMAEVVTNVSGRGVGMDVVRTKIEAIGGTVDVESEIGRGTTWRLRIPLTLAIMPALTVEHAGELFAIPQVNLLELVALDAQKTATAIEFVGTAPVYRLRGQLLPLVALSEVLTGPGVAARQSDDVGGGVIAVLQADEQRFGLLVDRVLNTEEIVVKPVAARIKSIGVYTGATLLGDGRVALILDVQAIARRSLHGESIDFGRVRADDGEHAATQLVQMLVAGIGGGRRVAIPLSAVTRLEHLSHDRVELVGGREVVQYRESIIPLVRLDMLLGAPSGMPGDELLVVVYTRGNRSVAMVVAEVIDIVDDDGARHSGIDDPGLIGSVVLKDRVTELLDVAAAVRCGDPHFYDDAELELAGV